MRIFLSTTCTNRVAQENSCTWQNEEGVDRVGTVAPSSNGHGRKDMGTQHVEFDIVRLGALARGCDHMHCGALSVEVRRGKSRTCGFLPMFRNLGEETRLEVSGTIPGGAVGKEQERARLLDAFASHPLHAYGCFRPLDGDTPA